MSSSSSSSIRTAPAMLTICALLTLVLAPPPPGAARDRNDLQGRSGHSDEFFWYSRSGTLSALRSIDCPDDDDCLVGRPSSPVDFDSAWLDEISSWLDSGGHNSAPPCAPSDDADRLGRTDSLTATLPDGALPSETALDLHRSEAELAADSVLTDFHHSYQSDYGFRAIAVESVQADGAPHARLGEYVPELGPGCGSESTESDVPGKRARSAAKMTTSPSSRPSCRRRVGTPESGWAAASTESTPQRATSSLSGTDADSAAESLTASLSAVRQGQADNPIGAGSSGGGVRHNSRPIKRKTRRHPKEFDRSVLVWQAIVEKGFCDKPLLIPDSETHLPCTKQRQPIPGAVPHLNDHSDMDRVMSHYARWFGPPSLQRCLEYADINYRRNLQCLIICYYYHCNDRLGNLNRRHGRFKVLTFEHRCNGTDKCNYREKSLQRFLFRFAYHLIYYNHPKLNINDFRRIESWLWNMISTNPERIRSQADSLAQMDPPGEPGRVPRLNDFSSMDLVLAHYAAVFGPDGTHPNPNALCTDDLNYRWKLALLLHCYFRHSQAVDESHYERYGAYMFGSSFLLCNGVDKCRAGWIYNGELHLNVD